MGILHSSLLQGRSSLSQYSHYAYASWCHKSYQPSVPISPSMRSAPWWSPCPLYKRRWFLTNEVLVQMKAFLHPPLLSIWQPFSSSWWCNILCKHQTIWRCYLSHWALVFPLLEDLYSGQSHHPCWITTCCSLTMTATQAASSSSHLHHLLHSHTPSLYRYLTACNVSVETSPLTSSVTAFSLVLRWPGRGWSNCRFWE